MGTTAQKLTYLSTTKDNLKTAINYTGANITTEKFRAYPEKLYNKYIDIINNGTDSLYNNLPKVTGAGTNISLANTANCKMQLSDYKGQTTQASTPTPSTPQPINVVTGEQDINVSGINLLPNELPTTNDYGITITKNNDGTYTANGTATSDFSYAVNNANFISLSGTWRLTGCPSGGSASTYMLSAYTGSWGTTSPYIDTGNGTNITYTGNVKIRFYIKSGTHCDNLIFKPMITTDTSLNYDDFQPYRITYELNLGKNLFDISTSQSYKWLTYQGVIQDSSDPNIVSAFIKVENGKQYIFSGIPTGTYTIRVCSYTGTTTNTFKTLLINNNSSIRTFTADADYIVFAIGQTDATTLTSIQLTKGSTPQRVSDNPIELCKIGTYQDYIRKSTGKNLFDKNSIVGGFVNADGTVGGDTNAYRTSDFIPIEPNTAYYKTLTQSPRTKFYNASKQPLNTTTYQDISIGGSAGTFTTPSNAYYLRFSFPITGGTAVNTDTIMVHKGSTATSYEPYGNVWYLHKEIGKKVITGSDSTLSRGGTNSQGYRWRVTLDNPLPNTSTSTIQPLYCDKLVGVTPGNTYNGIQGITIDTANDYCFFYITDIKNNSLDNTKTWLNTNNLTLYYILKEATDTPIEDSELLEQLESVSNANSCTGQTNISITSNDLPLSLSASAVRRWD